MAKRVYLEDPTELPEAEEFLSDADPEVADAVNEDPDPSDGPAQPTDKGNSDELARLKAERDQMQQTFQAIQADPLLLDAIQRRARNEEFEIVDKKAKKAEEPADDNEPDMPVDYESMSPQELARHVQKQTAKSVEARLREEYDKRFEELDGKVSQTQQYVQTSQKEQVKARVAAVRNKYKDFDDYKSDIVQLNKTHPSLDVEQLYMLAKAQKGGFNKAPAATNSEKPTSTAAVKKKKTAEDQPVRRGRAGFQEILGEALGELDLDSVTDFDG